MNSTVAFVALTLRTMQVVGSLAGCSRPRSDPFEKEHLMAERTIEQVQEAHTEAWMAMPGVVGTAIGLHKGEPCILILTAANAEAIRAQIPERVEGYPVIIQQTGEIRAREKP